MIRQRGYYDSAQNLVTQVIAYMAVEMGKTMYKDETIRGRHKPANGIGLSLNLNKLFSRINSLHSWNEKKINNI